MKRNDLTGMHINEWDILEYLGNKQYLCRCSCGEERIVSTYKLTSGQSKSCGHSSNSFIDLTGQKFGDWEVLEYAGNHKWRCKCSCGNIGLVESKALRDGKSTSCGHNTTKFKDLTNKVFGDWIAKEFIGNNSWRCECSCGKMGIVKTHDLISGKSKSCGHDTTGFKDLTGKKFGNLKVLKYAGNQKWVCECICGNTVIIDGQKIKSGRIKSCGCKLLENMRKTSMEKYGVPFTSQRHLSIEQVKIASSKENLEEAIKSHWKIDKPTPAELSTLLGLTTHRVMVKVREFGLEDLVSLNRAVSKYENELNKLFPCNHMHDRNLLNGKELDFYYPEHNLAIEFNGTYWHSETFKNKKYHQDKTIQAYKKGVHIIHIFEHEWNDIKQKEKIISLIKRKIQTSKIRKIWARKCIVKEISYDESKEFLNKYHLQNAAYAQVYIGGYFKDELVGIMTFGKPRFNNNYQYELIRLCWKSDVNVIGGSEKLFKYFKIKYTPDSIVTYCDISKFTGNVYIKLGFKTEVLLEPNYIWINPITDDKMTRYQTMKHRLIKLGLGNKEQTEDEIMEALGYLKIYDCGNLKLVWSADKEGQL